MKTFKLLLADDKYCAQFDSILHTLPKYCQECKSNCAGSVQSGRDIYTVFAGYSYCRWCLADCGGSVQSAWELSTVCTGCWNCRSAEQTALIAM